jgi:hypothetical protein
MKIRTLLSSIIVSLLASFVTANAADWYAVSLRGSCKYVNGSDRIARRPFSNTTLIRDYIATQAEPPLARHLKIAYDPEADKISIVNTNGESVLDVYTFGAGTLVANSSDTLRERQVFLFPGDSSEATGAAQLSERVTRDEGGLIARLTTRGSFQFANSATAELPAEICSGTFTVSRKLKFSTPATEPE